MIVTVLPLNVIWLASPTAIVRVSVPLLITMLPEPATTLSLNVSTTLLPTATAVTLSAGVLALRVGAVVSITSALLPDRLFAPAGSSVDVNALPARSLGASLPEPSAIPVTARSVLVSPKPTVYTPVSVVPVATETRSTVLPVSSVSVIFEPPNSASLAVAVKPIVSPAL